MKFPVKIMSLVMGAVCLGTLAACNDLSRSTNPVFTPELNIDYTDWEREEVGPILTGKAYRISGSAAEADAPQPYGPVPSAAQMKYYKEELSMFIHFGINTFTNQEWGDGTEDENLFQPTDLDTDQWLEVASDLGFGRVILTSKHHDGFVLYPTEYTDHSVKSSSWKNGEGDVVKSFVDSCNKYGLGAGIYLSPWDRNMPSYNRDVDPDYNNTYVNMIKEIFDRYGNEDNSNIVEFWLDGACGSTDIRPTYDYSRWWNTLYGYNNEIIIKSEYGSNAHWIGTPNCNIGESGDQNWQTLNNAFLWAGFPDKQPSTSVFNAYLNNGTPYIEGETGQKDANIWSVSEADISIRTTSTGAVGAWFWSPEDITRSPENLAEIYFNSVGRGGVFLLNVPPTTEGKFEDCDIEALEGFRSILDNTFSANKALSANITASETRSDQPAFSADNLLDENYDTFWTTNDGSNSGTVTLTFDTPAYMDVVELQEYIPLGQRIHHFKVEVQVGSEWQTYYEGTTIGYKRLVKGAPLTVNAIRVTVDGYDVPILNHVGVYKADRRIQSN